MARIRDMKFDMTPEAILEELMSEWSMGNCAGVLDYIHSRSGAEQIACWAVRVALAIQSTDTNETNQADFDHFMYLLED